MFFQIKLKKVAQKTCEECTKLEFTIRYTKIFITLLVFF